MTESGEIGNLHELEKNLKALHNDYYEMEWTWAAGLLEKTLDKKLEELSCDDLVAFISEWKECVTGLDKLLYEDARKEFRLSAMTGYGMDGDKQVREQDFIKVREPSKKTDLSPKLLNISEKKRTCRNNDQTNKTTAIILMT